MSSAQSATPLTAFCTSICHAFSESKPLPSLEIAAALPKHHAALLADQTQNVPQAEAPESNGAIADLQFDTEEAAPSGYNAFADLVQMAVREDPSLASVASSSGLLTHIQTHHQQCAQLHWWKVAYAACYTCTPPFAIACLVHMALCMHDTSVISDQVNNPRTVRPALHAAIFAC